MILTRLHQNPEHRLKDYGWPDATWVLLSAQLPLVRFQLQEGLGCRPAVGRYIFRFHTLGFAGSDACHAR